MKNKTIKDLIISNYGGRCFATGIIVKKSLTLHHLEKVCDGGGTNAENGVNLIHGIHDWFHNEIEFQYPEMFDLINTCLKSYKNAIDCRDLETVKMWENEIQPIFYGIYYMYLDTQFRGCNWRMMMERNCRSCEDLLKCDDKQKKLGGNNVRS